MKTEVEINNNLLIWAVERAGLNLDEISRRMPNFTAWLEGKKRPTIKQLEKFAQAVHVPFGYLFLDDIPQEKIPIPYFRKGNNGGVSLNVYDTVLILQQRMLWLSEYLREMGEPGLNFVGSKTGSRNVDDVVKSIRDVLGMQNNWAKEFISWKDALKHLTLRTESIGVSIVFNSIVGNNTHRSISVEECRGFVLTDEYAPFMFINAADSKAAQMFTIVHELAHIWIGKSAGFDLRELTPAEDEAEMFCNEVAAELLVPQEELKIQWQQNVRSIKKLANHFKVSQLVTARRLLDLGFIEKNEFLTFYTGYIRKTGEIKEKQKGGGDFYNTQNRRIGVQFAGYIRHAIRENKILYRDAWQLTGLKGNTFEKFINQLI